MSDNDHSKDPNKHLYIRVEVTPTQMPAEEGGWQPAFLAELQTDCMTIKRTREEAVRHLGEMLGAKVEDVDGVLMLDLYTIDRRIYKAV